MGPGGNATEPLEMAGMGVKKTRLPISASNEWRRSFDLNHPTLQLQRADPQPGKPSTRLYSWSTLAMIYFAVARWDGSGASVWGSELDGVI